MLLACILLSHINRKMSFFGMDASMETFATVIKFMMSRQRANNVVEQYTKQSNVCRSN